MTPKRLRPKASQTSNQCTQSQVMCRPAACSVCPSRLQYSCFLGSPWPIPATRLTLHMCRPRVQPTRQAGAGLQTQVGCSAATRRPSVSPVTCELFMPEKGLLNVPVPASGQHPGPGNACVPPGVAPWPAPPRESRRPWGSSACAQTGTCSPATWKPPPHWSPCLQKAQVRVSVVARMVCWGKARDPLLQRGLLSCAAFSAKGLAACRCVVGIALWPGLVIASLSSLCLHGPQAWVDCHA